MMMLMIMIVVVMQILIMVMMMMMMKVMEINCYHCIIMKVIMTMVQYTG